MIALLANRNYTCLFSAQVVSLLGTGLMTIALGLLAFDLAQGSAGAVLGTAYAIKMVAYVGLSPIMAAAFARAPRKAVLIGADLVRASVALALPFVSEVWHIYVLIFLLQSASASFTPVYQSILPDVLPDEDDYTKALSLSRLAYDLENLLSPALAAILLLVVSYATLFAGTVLGFLLSAAFVYAASIPTPKTTSTPRPFRNRVTRGSRIYLSTPRLRGLLSLNVAAAAIGAFVLVNTVVLVRAEYGMDERALGYAMAAFGGGSMFSALLLPRLLKRVTERTVMVRAASMLALLAMGFATVISQGALPPWRVFLVTWFAIGAAYSATLTPSGRLLRISAHAEDRPAIFAAQFALSHACWLVTYPMAGLIGQKFGLGTAFFALGFLAVLGVMVALRVWPSGEGRVLEHSHPDLPEDHPHLQSYVNRGRQHSHVFVIDDEHRAWPTNG